MISNDNIRWLDFMSFQKANGNPYAEQKKPTVAPEF